MNVMPDFFQELTGWRKFMVRSNGLLSSVALGTPFPVSDIGPAFCTSVAHVEPAPVLTCWCGFYAYKRRGDAVVHAQGELLVKVALWGRIAEHARGYRAERMRLVEAFIPENFPYALDLFTTRYAIPFTIDEGVPSWISENPSVSLSLNPSILSNHASYQIGSTILYPSQSQTLNSQFPPVVSPQFVPSAPFIRQYNSLPAHAATTASVPSPAPTKSVLNALLDKLETSLGITPEVPREAARE